MTRAQLILRSLLYYWRTNLAILLGLIVGTAVIAGALIIGDSVRGSLRQMSLTRVGGIDHALHGERFFREEIAESLANDPEFSERFATAAPALVLTGSLEFSDRGESDEDDTTHRASGVSVFGLDERLWELLEHGDIAVPADDAVALSERLAEQLSVSPGDDVSLWVELPSAIPRDSLLGERDELSQEIILTVSAVLDESLGAGRLGLRPNQQLPLDAFVSLDTLQDALDLAQITPTRRNPVAKPARVNALFVAAKRQEDQTGPQAPEAAAKLTELFGNQLTLADLLLRIVGHEQQGYLSVESEQMILEDALVQSIRTAAEQLQRETSGVLVYIANQIRNADPTEVDVDAEEGYSMYSIVAGLEMQADPPFGPWPLQSGRDARDLSSNEIVLTEWLAEDLNVDVGERVVLTYHVVGSHGDLPEESIPLTVRDIVRMEGPAADRGLTPKVEGITDVESLRGWDQPFPMDVDRITTRDEEYWDAYRATPKAYVSLPGAQDLWSSRYGSLTSLRIAADPQQTLAAQREQFAMAVLDEFQPMELGLAFTPLKYNGVQAAVGANDFTVLFLAFSFFLILSAAILIGLLYRLGIEQRARQVGLLSAVGLSPQEVRRQLFAEGAVLSVLGGVLGLVAGIGYAHLMVYGLKTWWVAAIGTQYLNVYITASSLLGGALGAVAIGVGVIWWSLRRLNQFSTRELLQGTTEQTATAAVQARSVRRRRLGVIVCFGLCALLLVAAVFGLIPTSEAFGGFSWVVVTFFVIGFAFLTGGLLLLALWLAAARGGLSGTGLSALSRLGARNAARHRQRSILTVSLIASATFVIVAVAAGHRNPAAEYPDLDSGNGGFLFVAESAQPILFDLNTEQGRDRVNLPVDESDLDAVLLEQTGFMAFRMKPGEDSSCLNLYRTQLPTILGVPDAMIERGGFKFADTPSEQPWQLLTSECPDEDGRPVIPVLGDMNTLQYSLKLGIGDRIAVPDQSQPEYDLEVAGMFDGSVFQGVLLMSQDRFDRIYTDEPAGYRYFLIELPDFLMVRASDPQRIAELEAQLENAAPDSRQAALAQLELNEQRDPGATARRLEALLETRLNAFGFDVERVAERLANFLQVQNTYLSTFQTLGALGLLLGTLGLATVMLRNVLERRAELALMRAVGYQNRSLAYLVLWENAFLLSCGLLLGTTAALSSMFPHLTTAGAEVPWRAVWLMLGGVFAVGMLAALLAVLAALRTPVLATLRGD